MSGAALPPGSTIGIFGGGQLGRMLAMAAAQLGYRCHIFAPEADSVAAQVSTAFTCADYFHSDHVRAFARSCDVLTYEFENVPITVLAAVEDVAPILPPIAALEVSQVRSDEKVFARGAGAQTAPYVLLNSDRDFPEAIDKIGFPMIVKTVRFGYDGKGQARIEREADVEQAWHSLKRRQSIAEGVVEFDREFSIILVRGRDGEIRFWNSCENRHEGGILARTTVPAHPDILAQQEEARAITARIADILDYTGVLTVEYFASREGPVFNEMAPRVHNSGHWTIEGAVTSQFANHIRAICGLPLGATDPVAPRVEMRNLIGGQADGSTRRILAEDRAHLHLYGKVESRPGRKMGHVTKLG